MHASIVSSKAPSWYASRKGFMKLQAKKQNIKVFKKRRACLGYSFFHNYISTLSNMSTFNSAMNTISQYQNPNPNHVTYRSLNQINEFPDFELSTYFTFDDAFEEEISTQNMASFSGSSNSSTPLAIQYDVIPRFFITPSVHTEAANTNN
ncbi:Uncharacterized protein Fot_25397 [Forsythia ovata]|uniref:Uncharacterized protein n=1 Tax=Forsythia ovata TaxID=205694 RepID=A0ABD1U8X7_9LAMI